MRGFSVVGFLERTLDYSFPFYTLVLFRAPRVFGDGLTTIIFLNLFFSLVGFSEDQKTNLSGTVMTLGIYM